jgi:tetratricopeptide (TPR) repeat protein
MGNAYAKLGFHHEAIQCHQKAVAIAPAYATAYYDMGSIYAELGDEQEQIKSNQQAARLGHYEAQELLRQIGHSW